MLFDRLPPLQTLRAFEATARRLSMTLAAEELHVTHGAISRQIRTLETHLGVMLFHRQTRRIVLTEEGAAFHVAVTRILGELTNEAEQLRGNHASGRLRISTSVSFASKWLAPRLHRLKAQCPQYDIMLDVTDENVDLGSGRVDVAIRYGKGRYPNIRAERILDETVTPVCSPALNGITTQQDLMSCTLIHEDRMLANWQAWFRMIGLPRVGISEGIVYSHGSMAIEAAIRSEGVALGRSALVTDDIVAGRLITPFPHHKLSVERGYDLVCRIGAEDSPKYRALRDWLFSEVALFRQLRSDD